MWSGYMKEAKNHDERVSDAWKNDAEGVLVFVSLNTAIYMAQRIINLRRLAFFPPP